MNNEEEVPFGEKSCLKETNVSEAYGDSRSTMRIHLVDRVEEGGSRGTAKNR